MLDKQNDSGSTSAISFGRHTNCQHISKLIMTVLTFSDTAKSPVVSTDNFTCSEHFLCWHTHLHIYFDSALMFDYSPS